MKKFLLGSIAFFLFSISVSILQTSCDKDADAFPENTEVYQLNKLFYIKYSVDNYYTSCEIWSANYDGTEQRKINITMPAGYSLYDDAPCLSPDRKKIFFAGKNPTTHKAYIFSCNIDGSNVMQLIDISYIMNINGIIYEDSHFIGGAY